MNVNSLIEDIKETISEDKVYYNHKHILIIGANNSGKSKIIKNVIRDLKEQKILYFIDSPNRTITTERTEFRTFSDLTIDEIVKKRIQDKYFNKVDIFTDSFGNEIVLSELFDNFEEYRKLFREILGIEIHIEKNKLQPDNGEQSLNIVDIKDGQTIYFGDNELELISDAQHSMIRILMELNFAYKSGCRVIFIDEFDMNLDYINAGDFIEKLKERYPELRFIISAHSLYTVLGANNFDIIKIIKKYETVGDNPYVRFDSNDLDNTEIIDKKLFRRDYLENDVDIILSNSLKNAILGKTVDISELNKLDNLSIRQKVIHDYILKRKKL
ncbi:hypothetical protein FCV36_12490 [Clostridium sporogenes]|uniref:hypothetical protein n=1 Tax=Clostridium sporogenes TaxID=1509 RepID=UPI0013D7F5D3|nr:hypothetical protein [Clostridium sporogenes]NFG03104.1 hypothetical protein [Clostridium sporogenes]